MDFNFTQKIHATTHFSEPMLSLENLVTSIGLFAFSD